MMAEKPGTAASTPPLVFISYSHKDEEWKDRLRTHLKPAEHSGLITVWDDRRIEAGESWDEAIQQAIERTAVAVLLITADFLASDWVMQKEAGRLQEQQNKAGMRIVPLLIRPCDWVRFRWLSNNQALPRDGKFIAETSKGRQDKLFTEAAKYIVDAATRPADPLPQFTSTTQPQPTTAPETVGDSNELRIDELFDFDLSVEVRVMLNIARTLATLTGRQPPLLTTSCLLFGIAESWRGEPSLQQIPRFLWERLQLDGGERYRDAFQEKFPKAVYESIAKVLDEPTSMPTRLVTPNVVTVFRTARDISSRVGRGPSTSISSNEARLYPGRIFLRSLLAALLAPESVTLHTGAMSRLLGIRPDEAQLRKELFNFIVTTFPGDNREAWRATLIPEEEEEVQTVEVDERPKPEPTPTPEPRGDARTPLVEFLADAWAGEDLLDITPDVNALASLVAAWTIEPPLAIGLFGDWGSGKSHFMRQMRKRVETLSLKARKSRRPQKEIAYYKNIAQIEFNAWHYIEGNLWASLVEHIFAHLKLHEKEKPGLAEERRANLMVELGVKKQLQDKAEERKRQLKVKEKDARARAEDARTRREDTSNELQQLRDELKSRALNQLNVSVQFSPEQEALLTRLGVAPGSVLTPSRLHQQYLETKSLWGRVRAQVSIFRKDPRRLRKIALSLALLVIPALVGFAVFIVGKGANGAWAALGTVATFLLTLLTGAKPYWEQFKKGLSLLEEKNREIDNERQKRITELETEVNALSRQYLDAEREADSINRQVEDLETEIKETTAGKILAEFIEDRAACSDYRRHLGVLALIRRDFERLAALFGEQREEEKKGKEKSDAKTINRIVLYIDDLDRCPPERVVQVLQAIHLLLAFPLFVVVVGVDARWVTRSLQESYEWLRAEADADGHEQKRDDAQATGEVQGATPHDYLEKIFQIPFWLKPMEDDDCKDLIEGLTKNSREDSGDAGNGRVGRKSDEALKANEARPEEAVPRATQEQQSTETSTQAATQDGDAGARSSQQPAGVETLPVRVGGDAELQPPATPGGGGTESAQAAVTEDKDDDAEPDEEGEEI
ncbi:MAG TPA: P-loop NTPase fold protein, partial [Pyrinomonadaceae bacterium]|nr:P-loop NTPase fold protein [Pyrinomonadaceae bacterium]